MPSMDIHSFQQASLSGVVSSKSITRGQYDEKALPLPRRGVSDGHFSPQTASERSQKTILVKGGISAILETDFARCKA
jgi:hypothetical protein